MFQQVIKNLGIEPAYLAGENWIFRVLILFDVEFVRLRFGKNFIAVTEKLKTL